MEVSIKERPIIFSGPMVIAIRKGRKTQTRRIVKPLPSWYVHSVCRPDMAADSWGVWFHSPETERVGHLAYCPQGKPKDRLWVRESYCPARWGSYEALSSIPKSKTDALIQFRADYVGGSSVDYDGHWKSAIFLPRFASRLLLQIESVRVERLQDISEEDAKAEGTVVHENPKCQLGVGRYMYSYIPGDHTDWELTARESYRKLWDSLNFKRGQGWDTNPWVWAITFKEVK